MLTLLSRLFIRADMPDTQSRARLGMLAGALGIFLNLVLFGCKLAAGIAASSIAIQADAFNNLTDAASSVIALAGFWLAAQKPDKEHPFGHGRVEYIAGFIVSALIFMTGVELLRSSIDAISRPAPAQADALTMAALVFSLGVKLYMFAYYRAAGKRTDSEPLLACSSDSLYDMLATGIVLVGIAAARFAGVQVDGWCGLAVSLFVIKGGISSAASTVGDLIGKPPEEGFIREIEDIVLGHEAIHAMHDLVVHDYGPGRRMVTLHAEVPADGDMLALHDEIDNIERELEEKLGCAATIHMDPILTHDSVTAEAYEKVRAVVRETDPALQMHDFRIVDGPTHRNLIFDVVMPFHFRLSVEELVKQLSDRIHGIDPAWHAVIHVDRSFTGEHESRAHKGHRKDQG